MKKLICILLCILLLFTAGLALVSCGDNDADGDKEDAEEPILPDAPSDAEQKPSEGDGGANGESPENPFDGGMDPDGWT